MRHKLSRKRLEAICEALNARLAGQLDGGFSRADYEAAWSWAEEEAERRRVRKAKRGLRDE